LLDAVDSVKGLTGTVQRLRLVAMVPVVVVVVILLTVVSTVITDREASPSAAQPDSTPSPIGTLFDPMIRPATIGYFPAVMSERQTSIGPDSYAVATTLFLEVWREGTAPWQQSGSWRIGDPVDQINGHPAFWTASAQALRWEFRAGAWIQLRLEQTIVNADVHPAIPFPDPGLAVTERVARSVRFQDGERVRFPWHLRGMPSGLVPLSVQITRDPSYQPWTAELVLAQATRPGTVAVIVRSTALPASAPDNQQPRPSADVVISDDGRSLVANRNGVRHELVFAATSTPAPSVQSLRTLFAGFEFFDDQAAWTDRPIDQ
jgi:hypothetical protein